jgi:hypothetical protein
MGYDLMGHGGASFQWDDWHQLLRIAVNFGWQPAGTVAPSDYDGQWGGWYCTNDMQEVTKNDARALGVALYRAIVVSLKMREALTVEQAKAVDGMDVRTICELAFYAVSGGFDIA